jgi:hypothetical protein
LGLPRGEQNLILQKWEWGNPVGLNYEATPADPNAPHLASTLPQKLWLAADPSSRARYLEPDHRAHPDANFASAMLGPETFARSSGRTDAPPDIPFGQRRWDMVPNRTRGGAYNWLFNRLPRAELEELAAAGRLPTPLGAENNAFGTLSPSAPPAPARLRGLMGR